jgi:sigma-B regulation protein RsbU (phosphoserine phosphatase)
MKKLTLYPKSLQQRTLYFILIPTFLLLLGMSVAGYLFVRTMLLNQWGETAIAKLQRTAHQVDMRLRKPKELLQLLQGNQGADVDREFFRRILERVKATGGVTKVQVDWLEEIENIDKKANTKMAAMMGEGHRFMSRQIEISSPKYSSQSDSRIVSLVSQIRDSENKVLGKVEVTLSFDDLIDPVVSDPWWKGNKAYLVDDKGNVLVGIATSPLKGDTRIRGFGTDDNLERDTLTALQLSESGMVFGEGSPPQEISGFYRLMEAPWTMVVIAPGNKVLQPIIRFKLFYILSLAICIVSILLFIRRSTSQVTSRIKEITTAANELSKGNFGPSFPVTTRDEVGELTKCFNNMTEQLQQRILLKEAISVAREVQQNLLPQSGYSTENVNIAGVCVYCDETGGDYFDIIEFPGNIKKVAVVVGDVVGHGIGAALLMTTVRALLRSRIALSRKLDQVFNEVNELLCLDTGQSGNFVTLFCLEIDKSLNSISWVRGGHDPALVFSPKTQEFEELKGNGIALGIDADCKFEYNEIQINGQERLILLMSDGAWEVENETGVQFGKERIKQIILIKSYLSPEALLQVIVKEIDAFKGNQALHDDITLALIKIN